MRREFIHWYRRKKKSFCFDVVWQIFGLPLAMGGILAFGIPRVAISHCYAREKPKSDRDLEVAAAPVVAVVAAPSYSSYHYPAPSQPQDFK